MFENVPGTEPEDMFAKVEAPAPPPPTARPTSPMPVSSPLVSVETSSGGGFPWKGLLVGVIALAVVGAGGALSYYVLSSRSAVVPQAPAPTPTPAVPTNGTLNVPTNSAPATTAPPAIIPPVTSPTPTPAAAAEPDSDNDGLTDAQEAELGTDPKKADSDADGLSDGQEVNVTHTNPLKTDTDGDGLTDGEEVNAYHTDPLKADTDGDGFSDGTEVKNGYNPNGPGKLFQVPTKS